VKNKSTVSEDVKRFQMFNIYFMKVSGLEFARKIDKGWFEKDGPLQEMVDRCKTRYEGYFAYLID